MSWCPFWGEEQGFSCSAMILAASQPAQLKAARTPGCRAAAARVASAVLPPPPPAGLPPNEAELDLAMLAIAAIRRWRILAGALLPPLKDAAVCERLGSGAAYRLFAACSWGFGEDAVATLQAHVGLTKACGAWESVVNDVVHAIETLSIVLSVVSRLQRVDSCSSGAPPAARAMLATLCKEEKLLGG